MLALGAFGCGGGQRPATPAPQTPNEALTKFLEAVKANDLGRMGSLWGTERGPAAAFLDDNQLKRRLATIQVHWDHKGYRIVDGPLPAQPLSATFKNVPSADRLRDFRVELQRANGCSPVIPITLVRTNQGGWLIYDAHLESAGNPAARCPTTPPGTRP
jgi:hypothetical protein